MKNVLLCVGILLGVVIALCLTLIGLSPEVNTANYSNQLTDSLSVSSSSNLTAYEDSLYKVYTNDSLNVLKKYESEFNKIDDEFSDNTWVYPKDAPKYRNRNAIYCYFAMKDNKPTNNFRLVFQYYKDEWLFIRSIIFNIDGENITIYPRMETDCGYGGYIWEWFDESYEHNLEFIEKLANAKSVKLKLNGAHYYETKTLTTNQIKSIKETYNYYKILYMINK